MGRQSSEYWKAFSRTAISNVLECFFQRPALGSAFSGYNSADRFLFLAPSTTDLLGGFSVLASSSFQGKQPSIGRSGDKIAASTCDLASAILDMSSAILVQSSGLSRFSSQAIQQIDQRF